MNTQIRAAVHPIQPHKGIGGDCPICGHTMSEVERIQEYTAVYILYRCQSQTCGKESLEKWNIPIRDW